ncbi:MAG TPA: indole-3-glycerol-phosphate synthase [Flavobacteriales bacterium]|nr:indole-3-glycerol-phosphate synthase [Flavobacteriales bacterium]
MNILNKIIESTQKRVDNLKNKYKKRFFEESELFHSPIVSLSEYLVKPGKNGIIAEFKRCSPSKGTLNAYATVSETTIGYMRAGCSALSVLTEPEFFKGKNEDLIQARKYNFCPILRKDFIIDPIQVYESRAIGADAILLIAKALSVEQVSELTACAHELDLEVLFEVDDPEGISKIGERHKVVGINARNLANMEENTQRFIELSRFIPGHKCLVAESGINHPPEINFLRRKGFQGFLIGTAFMRTADPGKTCQEFCKHLDCEKEITIAK